MADAPLDSYQQQYGPPQTANTTAANGYQAAITDQLSKLQSPVTANNPVVQAQTSAYDLNAARGLRQNQSAIAEQNYARGTSNSGGVDAQQQQAREAASAGSATNAANVMATAEGQRQAALGQDLSLGQTGALEQQQITNQGNQFGSQLGLSYDQLAQQKAAQQAAINAQLKIAADQNALGYYNTDTTAATTTRGQDITGASSL